jgi:hypothetical protein
MIDIHVNDKESSKKLLFWRAVADLGIALRFLTVHALNRMVCGVQSCSTLRNGRCVKPSFLSALISGLLQQMMKITVPSPPLCWSSSKLLPKSGFCA